MNKTYKLISTSTGREVEVAQFTYSPGGRLVAFQWLKEPQEDKDIDWLGTAFPWHISTLQAIIGQVQTLSAVEFNWVPSFEEFWKKWEKKEKKARAQKEWDRLKDTEKVLAYERCHIPYLNANRETQFVPNPDTWLKEKRWDEELRSQRTKML